MRTSTIPQKLPTRHLPRQEGEAPKTCAGLRARRAAERRAAIMDAALHLFSKQGFAATRVEDIARRARVAKGTVYLNFQDKEALFEGIVRSVILPTVSELRSIDFAAIVGVRDAIERIGVPAVRQMARSRHSDVARLLIAEGPRFPSLAEFYFREVVEPGLAQFRRLLLRAVETGEIGDSRLAEFPHLLAAPAILVVLWQSLFEPFEPMDIDRLLRAHLDVLFGSKA